MTPSADGSGAPLQGFHPGLTIGQMASKLGVSPSTVRRWVRSGQLCSERVTVGDGFEYRIPADGLDAVRVSANPSKEAVTNGSTNASVPAILEASVERSTALAAYNAQLLGPLTAVIERQQDTIRQQAEQVGSLRAQLAAAEELIGSLEALQSPVAPNLGPQTDDPPLSKWGQPWWRRRWAPLVGTGLALAILTSSCQLGGSIKHPALCTAAKRTMDLVAPMAIKPSGEIALSTGWPSVESLVNVAEKVC